MKKTLFAAVAAGLLLPLLAAVPASAVTSTTVTVTIGAGALSISTPASADLGTVSPGASATGALGAVTVTDARALLTATWTASVVGTDFTTGGATPAETIPVADVSYWSGLATSTSGLGVFTPGQLTALLAQPISASITAYKLTLGVGNSTATWNPHVIIAVPAAAVTGVYTGTVTHSVA
jgi:hypothetical protein